MAEYDAGVQINAPVKGQFVEIITPEAIAFVAGLHRRLTPAVRSSWRRVSKDRNASMRASDRISCRRQSRFARASGLSLPSQRICWIVAWKSLAQSIAK